MTAMHSIRKILVGVILALALATGNGFGSGDVGEVGALLVYPVVLAYPGHESLLTLTNTSSDSIVAHVAFIDGDAGTHQFPNSNYCSECDFDLPMTGNDTEILRVASTDDCGTLITAEDSALAISCPQSVGMIVVTLEDEQGRTLTDNVLLGAQVLVDYDRGTASAVPALAFQGGIGNGDRSLEFNGSEYSSLPRVVGTGFLAPDAGAVGSVTADLALFTLGFDRQHPPLTDCSVTGFDADENPFSSSMQFGCWTLKSLSSMSPEFAYPNLGLVGNESSHGWLNLNCRVDEEADGNWDANGGVHGLIMQTMTPSGVVRPPFNGVVATDAAWSRILSQSVTSGDSLTLLLSSGGGLD
jgi:hypothetical protein